MNLPTPSQVNSVTRHAGSFAAGAIAMLGVATKVDPQTVVAIINSTGALVNDAILLIGLLTPFVTSWFAARSASPTNQVAQAIKVDPKIMIRAVQSLPQADVTVTDPKLAEGIPGVKIAA